MYVVAEHKESSPVSIAINDIGLGGPSQYVNHAGRNAVYQYLQRKRSSQVTIDPNSEKPVILELSKKSIQPGETLTLYADLHSEVSVNYKVIALHEEVELIEALPNLGYIPYAEKHTRGTFSEGNIKMVVQEPIGDEYRRIIIGDGEIDSFVKGTDKLMNTPEVNLGNRGVVYELTLEKVAPHTMISLNPRGGPYAGAFSVNGKVMLTPESGTINGPSEMFILHETNSEETVTIKFIPASGSNLPINLLIIPK